MPIEIVCRVITEAVEYNLRNGLGNAHFVFHGGEPLLAGIDYFTDVVRCQDELRVTYPGFVIDNSIQTNGSLLSEPWVELFRESRFSVGISIDGPGDLNGHCLSAETRNHSSDMVLKNMHRATRAGLSCAVLSVITDDHLDRADDYYRFLVENDIHDVGLCYCYGETDSDCVDASGLGEFLVNLFDSYFFGTHEVRIREFETLIGRIIGTGQRVCTACKRQLCGSYLTVLPDGSVHFCDSLTERGEHRIGSLHDSSLEALLRSTAWQSVYNKALAGIGACGDCPYLSVCGGGCFRNDRPLISASSDAGTRSYFCDAFRILIPHVQSTLRDCGYGA